MSPVVLNGWHARHPMKAAGVERGVGPAAGGLLAEAQGGEGGARRTHESAGGKGGGHVSWAAPDLSTLCAVPITAGREGGAAADAPTNAVGRFALLFGSLSSIVAHETR